ncbi:MAG: CHAD domain-containing protein [Phycisphaerales bacterium]|nr:MAG: CHAD domain-containing protein [Phycisphaerales bacterium]
MRSDARPLAERNGGGRSSLAGALQGADNGAGQASPTLSEALADAPSSPGEALGPGTPLLEAVERVLTARLDRVGRAAKRVVASDATRARAVHKLRVAARRAEAGIRAFEGCLPPEFCTRVLESLRVVRRPAGRVRDADVQIEVFGAVRARAEGGRARASSYMIGRCERRRERWRARLLEAIGDQPREPWRTLAGEVGSALRSGEARARSGERYADAAHVALDRLLASAMAQAGADLREAEPLHDFRLSVKALRYGLEAYRPCLEPGLAGRLDLAMRGLQDRLGGVQDAASLAERVDKERVRLVEKGRKARTVSRLAALAERADRVRAQRLDVFLRWWGARGSSAELSELRRALAEPTALPEGAEMRGHGLTPAASGSPAELISAHERIAAIDIGTNTVRLVAAEVWPDRRYRIIGERRLTPRLGEGLGSTGTLTDEAVERTLDAVTELTSEARRLGVTRLLTVATAATRDAANGSVFLDRAAARAGVEVRVIDPAEEGRLAYLSAAGAFGLGVDAATVVDLGGGSAELSAVRRGMLDWVRSAPIGAVRLTERFGGGERVRQETYVAMREHVEAAVGTLVEGLPVPIDATVGSGGSFTMVAKIVRGLRGQSFGGNGASPVHGMPVHRDEVSSVLALLRETPVASRSSIRGLSASRAEIALAGVLVIERVMSALGAQRVIVNARGMRDGLLLEMMGWTPGVEPSPPSVFVEG